MNELETTKAAIERARRTFNTQLLMLRDVVPQQARTCPVTGVNHSNPCDAWQECYYGDLSPRKWQALVKAAPEAARELEPIASELLALRERAATLRLEEKSRKAAKAAQRTASAYRFPRAKVLAALVK